MQNSKKDAEESAASADAVSTAHDSTGAAHTGRNQGETDNQPSNDVDNSEAKPETAPGKSQLFILLIMLGMVAAGSLCTIVGKIMD